MSEERSSQPERSRIVVVVGLDLSEVSEHLLKQARDLVRNVDDAEIHAVHVVRPEPWRERLTEPIGSGGYSTRALAVSAGWELERLCETVLMGSPARWVVHTPAGRPADEIARVARDVRADIVVVETYEHPRHALHRSVIKRVVHLAQCTVLAIRDPRRPESHAPAPS